MNQKYIDKETNDQNFQDALINNDADGIWQAVFFYLPKHLQIYLCQKRIENKVSRIWSKRGKSGI